MTEYDVKASFFCYMLFNWMDTPDNFWERIQIAQKIVDDVGETIYLFPQRYEPLDALVRNQFIGKHWDAKMVRGITRLYTQLHGFIPITRSRNVYDWIGHTKEEFLRNAYKMGTDDNFKLKKKPMRKLDNNLNMKFHPIASIFPMMDSIEFESLKADIQKHGQLEPIWTYEGKIIDGRNRYLACQELGIRPKIKEWKPANGVELVDFVISLNLQRRHLNASQKALVAVDALPYYEEAAKNRMKLSQGRGKKRVAKMPQVNFGRSRELAAQTFGVSGRYIGYGKQISSEDPQLAQEIRDGKKTITEALRIINKDKEVSKPRNRKKKFDFLNNIGMVNDDFYEWSFQHLKGNSIDLVMTEPHCVDADMFFWDNLAEVARRVLKPSGFFVAYCGQKRLNKIVSVLSKYLNYHWVYCINGNGSDELCGNGIIEQWQPVLIYQKAPFKKDRITTNVAQDQQQADKGISFFINMLSSENDIVFDPMVGNGDVLKITQSLNRKVIGIQNPD